MACADCVAVKPADASARECVLQGFLDLLRSGAKKIEVLAGTFRADFRHGGAIAAVMALQPLSRGHAMCKHRRRDRAFVMRQRNSAVNALQRFSAREAKDHR